MSSRAKKKRRKQQIANQVLEEKRKNGSLILAGGRKYSAFDMAYDSVLKDLMRAMEKIAMESAGIPQSPYPLGARFSNGSRLISVSLVDNYRTPEDQYRVPEAPQKVCLKCKENFRTWTDDDYCPECEKSRFKIEKMAGISKHLSDMAETANLSDAIKDFIDKGTTSGFSIVGSGKPFRHGAHLATLENGQLVCIKGALSHERVFEIMERLEGTEPILLEPDERVEYLGKVGSHMFFEAEKSVTVTGSIGGGMSWHNKPRIMPELYETFEPEPIDLPKIIGKWSIPDSLVSTSAKEWTGPDVDMFLEAKELLEKKPEISAQAKLFQYLNNTEALLSINLLALGFSVLYIAEIETRIKCITDNLSPREKEQAYYDSLKLFVNKEIRNVLLKLIEENSEAKWKQDQEECSNE